MEPLAIGVTVFLLDGVREDKVAGALVLGERTEWRGLVWWGRWQSDGESGKQERRAQKGGMNSTGEDMAKVMYDSQSWLMEPKV